MEKLSVGLLLGLGKSHPSPRPPPHVKSVSRGISVGLSFGKDLGPIKVYGLKAEHHCEVRVSGEVYGMLYLGNGVYEYRGKKGLGMEELLWVSNVKRDVVIERLENSLQKEVIEKRKQDIASWTRTQTEETIPRGARPRRERGRRSRRWGSRYRRDSTTSPQQIQEK